MNLAAFFVPEERASAGRRAQGGKPQQLCKRAT